MSNNADRVEVFAGIQRRRRYTAEQILRRLKDRGLKGVQLIISDACRGLVEAAPEFFPEARWQRCVVHFYRNVFSHAPNNKVAEVARMLKAIHAQEDAASSTAKNADLVEKHGQEALTYFLFPSNHWRQIKTNNPLERINHEIRRRTRVVGAFPDGHSAVMLVAARLRHIASTRWESADIWQWKLTESDSTRGSSLRVRPSHRQTMCKKYVALSRLLRAAIRCVTLDLLQEAGRNSRRTSERMRAAEKWQAGSPNSFKSIRWMSSRNTPSDADTANRDSVVRGRRRFRRGRRHQYDPML